MKTFIFVLLILFSNQTNAYSPKSDPSLMTVERLESSYSGTNPVVSYKVGSEAKNRILSKISDLSALENITYSVEEKTLGDKILLKITFKNGVLLEESLKKLLSQLP